MDTYGLSAREVLGARNPVLFRRFFDAYAANSAGIVTDRKLNHSARINPRTGDAYRRHLLNLMIVDEIPAWYTNRLGRLARSSKRYFTDSGLLAAALGADAEGVLSHGGLLVRVLKTFAVGQLRAEAAAVRGGRPLLHHLRSADGRRKVDLVIELNVRQVIGIQIKVGAAPNRSDAKHLIWLRDHLGDMFVGGAVLHTGPWSFRLADRITAAPISTLWA